MPQRTPLDIVNFLHNYRLHPCLWNRTHPNFKNRISREEAEAQLLPISGLGTVKELRQKIRNIRCTYNQELGKIRRSINAGASEIYEPKLVWFGIADSFLRVNHIEKFDDPTSALACNSPSEANGGGIPFLKQEFRVAEAGYPSPEEPEPASIQSPQLSPAPVQPSPPKKIKTEASNRHEPQNERYFSNFSQQAQASQYDSPADFVETVSHSPSSVDMSNTNNNCIAYPTNEFIVFGQHVASQLQQLPLEEAIKLEEEIQSLITRARLRSMHDDVQ